MKFTNVLGCLVLLIVLMSCSKSDDNAPDIPHKDDTDGQVPEEIPSPTPSALLFPKDNSECLEGEVLSDEISKITFDWEDSSNTDQYIIYLVNLSTNNTIFETTTETSITLEVERGKPFEWWIISENSERTKIAVSDRWQFYNAGIGTNSYAPFPAALIYPQDEGVIEYGADALEVRWIGNDVDNDIFEYELYFGTQKTLELPVLTTTDNSYWFWNSEYAVGTRFYWKVKIIDSEGNSSVSALNSFIVN